MDSRALFILLTHSTGIVLFIRRCLSVKDLQRVLDYRLMCAVHSVQVTFHLSKTFLLNAAISRLHALTNTLMVRAVHLQFVDCKLCALVLLWCLVEFH